MEINVTELEANETLKKVTQFFNINIYNLTNQSQETQVHLFDLYEAYRTREMEQVMAYKFVAYIIGALIILSNLTVVISSGLILKKGQQPKSTYLLLGNVSLADTIIGFSIIFDAFVDNTMNSNSMCIFQIGMLVCPAMVSIFSVGMIAVDRYIYILHGMYYQRWFTTTKVRIIILCIWVIGVTFGFMPVTGLINKEIATTRCDYVVLFPGSLILLNSLLSIVPIAVVVILYSIILVKALNNVKRIKAANDFEKSQTTEPKLRINRGNANAKTSIYHIKFPTENVNKLRRSASCVNLNVTKINGHSKSKSIDDLCNENNYSCTESNKKIFDNFKTQYDSEFSVCTVESSCSDSYCPSKIISNKFKKKKDKNNLKKPNKWRAITVVMLTSSSFVCTWLPFLIIVTFYVLCEEKSTNPKCVHYRTLLAGPMAVLAFVNSILNPLIYAWWHKGFQRSVIIYFRKYCCRTV